MVWFGVNKPIEKPKHDLEETNQITRMNFGVEFSHVDRKTIKYIKKKLNNGTEETQFNGFFMRQRSSGVVGLGDFLLTDHTQSKDPSV